MLEIDSTKFTKTRHVLLDGMEITMRPPGAGSELRFARTQRRIEFLEKKYKDGTITDEELDQLDKLDAGMLTFFNNMLTDGTADNGKIRAWLERTPLATIQATFEEMKRQFDETDNQPLEAGDGKGQEELPTAQA